MSELTREQDLDCGGHSCRFARNKTGMRHNGPCRCIDNLIGERNALCQRAEVAERLNTELQTKVEDLMGYYDTQVGTPCEQIWHQDEIASFAEKLALSLARIAELEARVRELELTWTTDRPTVAGGYQYRFKDNPLPVVLTQIHIDTHGIVWATFVTDAARRCPVDQLDGEWAGPIPLLKERQS